ncbi:MAG: hypothetical protein KBS74_06205 [Clostridiales bacterium]|nr:hypothetical protein [Candidatus Cacconaster stercorequi]
MRSCVEGRCLFDLPVPTPEGDVAAALTAFALQRRGGVCIVLSRRAIL